jgi:hypothetical protein
MDFGAVISRAVRITWEHKVLWILGFLAALGSSLGSTPQSPQVSTSFSSGDMPAWMQDLIVNPGTILAGLAGLGCVLLILGIVLLVVGIIARGGLIAGVQQVETTGSTTFGSSWRAGAARFWSLLGLSLLLWLPFILVIIILAVVFGATIAALIAGAQGIESDGGIAGLIGGGLSLVCCFACVITIYAAIASGIQVLGERAIILEDAGVIASISRAWALFRANLGNIILLAVLMFVISLAFGLVTGAISLALLFPTLLPAFGEATSTGIVQAGSVILAIIGVLLATVLIAIVNTLFVTFNSAAWTLAYRQFTGTAPSITTTPAAQPPLPL